MVPVKFSFLALVSARKATIFSDSLIDLMIHIAKRTFDGLSICLNEKAFEEEESKGDKSTFTFADNNIELDP